MPNTADHKADMAVLARQLDNAGKPRWAHLVNVADVFHNDELSLTEKRDEIVHRIRQTNWYRQADPDDDRGLVEIVDNLADVEDEDEFNGWWDELYDLADYDRAWIKTF